MESVKQKPGLVLCVVGFAVVAMVTRFNLRVVESRYQIAAFWIAALICELAVRPSMQAPLNWSRLFANGAAVTVAIVAVKWMTEGLPPILR